MAYSALLKLGEQVPPKRPYLSSIVTITTHKVATNAGTAKLLDIPIFNRENNYFVPNLSVCGDHSLLLVKRSCTVDGLAHILVYSASLCNETKTRVAREPDMWRSLAGATS